MDDDSVKIIELKLHESKVDIIIDSLKLYIKQPLSNYHEEVSKNALVDIENQLKEQS